MKVRGETAMREAEKIINLFANFLSEQEIENSQAALRCKPETA